MGGPWGEFSGRSWPSGAPGVVLGRRVGTAEGEALPGGRGVQPASCVRAGAQSRPGGATQASCLCDVCECEPKRTLRRACVRASVSVRFLVSRSLRLSRSFAVADWGWLLACSRAPAGRLQQRGFSPQVGATLCLRAAPESVCLGLACGCGLCFCLWL